MNFIIYIYIYTYIYSSLVIQKIHVKTRFLLLFFFVLLELIFQFCFSTIIYFVAKDLIFMDERGLYLFVWRTHLSILFFYMPVISLTWCDEPIFQFCFYMPVILLTWSNEPMSQNLFYMLVILWFIHCKSFDLYGMSGSSESIFKFSCDLIIYYLCKSCVLYSCRSVSSPLNHRSSWHVADLYLFYV